MVKNAGKSPQLVCAIQSRKILIPSTICNFLKYILGSLWEVWSCQYIPVHYNVLSVECAGHISTCMCKYGFSVRRRG